MSPKILVPALAVLCMACTNSQMKPQKAYIGPSDPVIEDGRMTPEVLLAFGRLSDPQLSPDGKTVLYGVSYTSVEENRSVRNLFVSPVGGGAEIYFLQGGQIWKAPFRNNKLGKRVLLSDVPEGISGFALSPDGSQVLYVSGVHSAVERPSDTDPALSKAKAYATEDLMYRHWDHWVEEIDHTFIATLVNGRITRGGSIDILGGEDVLYQLPNGPWGGVEQLSWSPDGNALAWLHMDRDGYEADKTELYVADLLFDRPEEGQGSNPSVRSIRNLTAGFAYNAAGPVWAGDSRSLYFNSLVEGLQGIFRVSSESAEIERLTGEELWYDFGSPFGVLEDGTLLATYCSMDFPTEIVSVKDGVPTPLTSENAHILSRLKEHRTEARQIRTVDGKDMLTWVLFPPEFDASKVYPAIEITLGGPQGTLSQGWSYRWNYCLMAHQGYVVVLPNRRGTTAFGQPWCEEISGDYIGLNMQDYLSAAKALKAEPYVGKMAACGASYGGYSVYYLAGIHGDVYDCFIAHAGIFNEEHMYMTTEEMWFPNWDNGGIPEEYAYTPGEIGPRGDGKTFGGMQQAGSPWSSSPKAVRHYSNSPHLLVKNWHTPILCIHGGSDFRVPVDEGMAAFNAAQMMGVPSKLIVFPDENHWILQPQNALYWHRSYFDWLSRWL